MSCPRCDCERYDPFTEACEECGVVNPAYPE